eukprot:312221_1
MTNERLIVLFDEIKINIAKKSIQCTMYVYHTLLLESTEMNLFNLIPTVSNNHPKLFIINTKYVSKTLIKSYFMHEGRILRFFPEHMCSVWPYHFQLQTKERTKLTQEHKYRHQFGLPLIDQSFC